MGLLDGKRTLATVGTVRVKLLQAEHLGDGFGDHSRRCVAVLHAGCATPHIL